MHQQVGKQRHLLIVKDLNLTWPGLHFRHVAHSAIQLSKKMLAAVGLRAVQMVGEDLMGRWRQEADKRGCRKYLVGGNIRLGPQYRVWGNGLTVNSLFFGQKSGSYPHLVMIGPDNEIKQCGRVSLAPEASNAPVNGAICMAMDAVVAVVGVALTGKDGRLGNGVYQPQA